MGTPIYIYGPGKKRPLNETQLLKQLQDVKKAEFAKKNKFFLFCIWEKDIREGNWRILEDIKNAYKV